MRMVPGGMMFMFGAMFTMAGIRALEPLLIMAGAAVAVVGALELARQHRADRRRHGSNIPDEANTLLFAMGLCVIAGCIYVMSGFVPPTSVATLIIGAVLIAIGIAGLAHLCGGEVKADWHYWRNRRRANHLNRQP